MDAVEVARRYFDAWNRRDPAGVAGMFADGGTYRDPATGSALASSAIAGYVQGLVTAFPMSPSTS
jgi:ketosteroid isomerase-like protein